ncbi:phosphatase PAP2 family protein [Serratia marcescens]|uniref:Lipid A 1-diphosphate synthase n=2 Tax=Serratia marcescens TaxID=615 RepID=A0A379Z3H7_SERMA|nr:phosphatase PAP2 family protein [Serratia marcescens]KFD13592.1 putative membrane protein [Serratia marcescens subsp. marcescens ATCC 13880]KFL03712.1 inner membrane protein yeiU [Serratia marcescens]MCC3248011.1 phosphatase PAP2 family protein [Serratia marcescens]PNU44405.1 phosphatase PAP2 family protein [Serratia marcescens subsp. marcescens ATCC 13880]QDL86335.1 phosphatase PAP2 family protein [Serratia marcescens subsp. marcescens ATCC 13880]
MTRRNLPLILFFNLLGVALFLSWFLPANHGGWFTLDSAIFFFFNRHLATDPAFLHLVAITNNRAFDAISLLAMGLLYLYFYLKQDAAGRRRLVITGVVMLLTAVVLNQLGHLLPVKHPSPTLTFDNIHRVSELTGIPTKDASGDSFPGDHGMMLIIFSCFMLRYFGRGAFAVALLITVVFSLPRVMIGAHWFTDIAVGSLSVVLVGASWVLITPCSDWIVDRLNRLLPGKHRPGQP